MAGHRVLGVDACKPGWIGVALDNTTLHAYFAEHIDELVSNARADALLDVVAIDMPIGLPDAGRRRADEMARAVIGPRRSSVFITPVRSALLAATHARAVGINRELAGEGVSIQAFGLRTKLLEVEQWVTQTDLRVIEVHPEVSFARLANGPLLAGKSTWAGAERRRELLEGAGIAIVGDLGAAGRSAAVDDVLDAAVAAWTAHRFARGDAHPMPDPPEMFSDGIACAIWA